MARVGLFFAALAVMGSVAVGLKSCSPPQRVFVIGDSLTVGAQQRGFGVDTEAIDWTVQAKIGRTTHSGMNIVADRDLSDYDLVIVALGTNDYLDSKSLYAARIDQMMAAIDDGPKVVWIDVDTHEQRLSPADDGVNRALAEAPTRHPRLTIGSWNRYLDDIDDFDRCREPDEVHYKACGYDVRRVYTESLVGKRSG